MDAIDLIDILAPIHTSTMCRPDDPSFTGQYYTSDGTKTYARCPRCGLLLLLEMDPEWSPSVSISINWERYEEVIKRKRIEKLREKLNGNPDYLELMRLENGL